VRKEDFAKKNYFDVWLPELSPSAPLVSEALASPWTTSRWERYAKRYRGEMSKPPAERIIATLAALSAASDFSIGCYCEDETRCHRSILRDILKEHGARVE
jgi:uncharacterized protein YeaO (DUF488 family)